MEMKTLATLVAVLLIFGAVITDGNLVNLQTMIGQVTGKSAIPYYIAYGCYCGHKGHGEPLDATDRCCRDHDCCYRRIIRSGCNPKWQSYSYTHRSGNVTCGGRTRCQQQICECDRDFVVCLKEHLGSYNKSYMFYWNTLCSTSDPGC